MALIRLRNGMNPTILPPAMVGQTGLFNFGAATGQGEENNLNWKLRLKLTLCHILLMWKYKKNICITS